jgi:hypothetical protein
VKKLDDLMEIDRLLPNGKIKRLYKHPAAVLPVAKTKGKKSNETAAEEVKMDSVMVVADTAVVAMPDSAATVIAEQPEETADTLTQYEYINDSTSAIIYYLPYTGAEKEAAENKQAEEKKLLYQQKLNNFLSSYKTYLPYTQNSVMVQRLQADTADVIIYGSNSAASYSPYNALGLLLGSTPLSRFANQPAGITSFNFINGQLLITSAYNCCDTGTALYEQFYKPLTGFWPAALGSAPLGNVQFNLNMPVMLNYIKQTIGKTAPMEKEMKDQGLEFDDLQKMFDGPLAISMQPGQSPRGKKQPRLFIAFKLKDAARAVAFMNRLGTGNKKFTNNYHFDENAQYLLFDTDGKNGLALPPAKAVTMPVVTSSMGSMHINIKAMITAFAKETQKTTTAYKQTLQFFNSLQMNTVKDAAGKLTATIRIDMGDTKSNALYSLMQFMKNNNGKKILNRLPFNLH